MFHHFQGQHGKIQVVWMGAQIGLQLTWVQEWVDVVEFEFLGYSFQKSQGWCRDLQVLLFWNFKSGVGSYYE